MAIGDDVRERVMEEAGPIFAEKGYRNTTIRGICSRARVNVAAINYYFGDKERLYLETVKRAQRKRLEEAPPATWPPSATPEEKLRLFIRALVHRSLVSAGAGWHFRLLMRELFEPTEACRELVREFVRPQFELLLSILDELVPPRTPLPKRHQIAFSIVGQCLHYRTSRPIMEMLIPPQEFATFDAETLAKHIADFSLNALAALRARTREHQDASPLEGSRS